MRMFTVCVVIVLLTAGAACGQSATSAPAATASADPAACPDSVKQAISTQFPGSSIDKCKAEHEDGHDQTEVKLADKDGQKLEADVGPDGTVLQIEQVVTLDQVPAKVMAAFTAKYPGAQRDAGREADADRKAHRLRAEGERRCEGEGSRVRGGRDVSRARVTTATSQPLARVAAYLVAGNGSFTTSSCPCSGSQTYAVWRSSTTTHLLPCAARARPRTDRSPAGESPRMAMVPLSAPGT